MNFGIAPKPGESTGDGPPPSCMSFVGLIRMGNYDNFNWKAKPSLGALGREFQEVCRENQDLAPPPRHRTLDDPD